MRIETKVKAILLAILVVVMLLVTAFPLLNQNTYTATVTEKEVKSVGDGDEKYLVFTELQNGELRCLRIQMSLLSLSFVHLT